MDRDARPRTREPVPAITEDDLARRRKRSSHLRIRRLGVRIPPSARTSHRASIPSEAGPGGTRSGDASRHGRDRERVAAATRGSSGRVPRGSEREAVHQWAAGTREIRDPTSPTGFTSSTAPSNATLLGAPRSRWITNDDSVPAVETSRPRHRDDAATSRMDVTQGRRCRTRPSRVTDDRHPQRGG
jgi:hypothetical protein